MAKKKSLNARTTISVPATLKKHMENVAEPVNWSAIAAAAFEQKLAEIAKKKEKKNMSDVIARLRATKRESDHAEYREGEAAGRRWAESEAGAVQLERLDGYFDQCSAYEADLVFEPVDNTYSGAAILHSIIEPDSGEDREAAPLFWSGVVGEQQSEKIYRPGFLRGFVDGAVDVWNKVKDQL